MPMFRAIGLIMMLIALSIIMPDVFKALDATLLAFFQALQNVLAYAGNHSVQNTASTLFAPPMYPMVPR